MMRGRVRRMESLINGLLNYSKVGRGEEVKEYFSTKDIVDEIVHSFSASNEPYQFKIDNDLPVINSTMITIHQVFSNLISNAIKYHDLKEKPIIEINYKSDNEYHFFEIKDNGPGIEEQYFERIFEIFQTLNPRDKIESTGIGLSIVKKIIEKKDGNIWIESEVGKGTSFIFKLPK